MSGKILGIIVFVIGVGLLVFVFSIVYQIFQGDYNSFATVLKTDKTKPFGNALGFWFIKAGIKMLMIIFMTITASLIANKGISLYFKE